MSIPICIKKRRERRKGIGYKNVDPYIYKIKRGEKNGEGIDYKNVNPYIHKKKKKKCK